MNPTLLIAEDDDALRQGLTDLLEGEGYRVFAARDGGSALKLWEAHRPSLIVLDVMMPEVNGFEVCRRIRRQDTRTPILFLTAKAEEVDQVVGLKLGGDDYVGKPFGMQALLARLEALRRRSADAAAAEPATAPTETFRFGCATVSRTRYELSRDGETFGLTPRELKLLEMFHAHAGQALGRDRLLSEIWGIDYYGTTRTLDQHIAQLRKKVEPDPSQPVALITVHGVGYRYQPSP